MVKKRRGLTTIRFRLGLAMAVALTPVLALGVLQALNEFRRDAREQTAGLTVAAQRTAAVARARMQATAAVLEILTPQAVGLQCAPRLAALSDGDTGYQNVSRLGRRPPPRPPRPIPIAATPTGSSVFATGRPSWSPARPPGPMAPSPPSWPPCAPWMARAGSTGPWSR